MPCPCHTHAVPLPCHALIHTCHAAPLPCSDSAVPFMKGKQNQMNAKDCSQQYYKFWNVHYHHSGTFNPFCLSCKSYNLEHWELNASYFSPYILFTPINIYQGMFETQTDHYCSLILTEIWLLQNMSWKSIVQLSSYDMQWDMIMLTSVLLQLLVARVTRTTTENFFSIKPLFT